MRVRVRTTHSATSPAENDPRNLWSAAYLLSTLLWSFPFRLTETWLQQTEICSTLDPAVLLLFVQMMCSGSASIRWKKMVSRAGLTILLLSVLIAFAEARFNSELYRRSNRSPAGLGPPVRPKVFHSADELTTYLAELADYYAVLGRPRWVSFLQFVDWCF